MLSRVSRLLPLGRLKARPNLRTWYAALLLNILWLVSTSYGQAEFNARIDDVRPQEVGIDFDHTDGGSGERYVVETVLGSLAVFDYDGDGWSDIYFINGSPLQGTAPDSTAKNRLYRNLGNWTFVDVTEPSGLGDTKYGMGVVVGDYDNDGDPDLFISNFGTNSFYINNGDGTFVESSAGCGLAGPVRVGAGNCFFDMDNDGDLDLYAASYIEFDYADHKTRTIGGHAFHSGPKDYPPAADLLYRNEGNGTFVEISQQAGIADLRAAGMGVLSADFDDDGAADVFVGNDQYPNFLLLNDGSGKFTESALVSGVALDRLGRRNGNMGVDFADLHGDGLPDLLTTTYQDEMPVIYQAIASGLFADSTNLARVDTTLNAHVTWGIGAVDFDLDGDRDIFVACGHFLDNIRFISDRTSVKVTNYLLANNGRGRFANVTSTSGAALQVIESSRSAVFDDLDNDGDVDLVVLNVNAPPTLGRTESGQANRLTLTLIGTLSNRDAVGSKVVVETDDGTSQTTVKVAGSSYQSYSGSRSFFGFGERKASHIRVTWPSGFVERFHVSARQMRVIEGQGIRE